MTTSSGDFTNFCAEMNENRENTVASGRSSVFARRRVAAVGVDRNRVRNPTDATDSLGHSVARTHPVGRGNPEAVGRFDVVRDPSHASVRALHVDRSVGRGGV